MKLRKRYNEIDIEEVGQIPNAVRAKVLIEALPWIKDTTGKTVVIKYGGAAMVDEELRDAVVSDIILLKLMGVNPIIVHGGGPNITAMADTLDLETRFEDGQRVTDEAMMDVVKMALLGQVNQELVSAINRHGSIAVGLNGADAKIVQAAQLDPKLGRVGKVEVIDTTLIEDLIADDYIPVIATVGWGVDGSYNINADTIAGEIAAAVGAQKIMFVTDVDGLYTDFSDKSTLVGTMGLSEAVQMAESGELAEGMIPKIDACVTALSAGVEKAHIVNGTSPHALVLEIFTDEGVGTMIERDGDAADPDFVEAPVSNFASKLDDPIHSFGRGA
ncbi:MAG: acetylglutamate kinase [Coriobacteriaceae bacterium]|nr:acetylglutamate kinase [Coriobacteriaceae bacterium]